MTYIVDAYELHLGDEIFFKDLLMKARVLYYSYNRGSLLFKGIFLH